MSLNQQSSRHNLAQNGQILDVTPQSLERFQYQQAAEIEFRTEDMPHRVPEELIWYRRLYESLPSVYLTVDTNGMILSVNQFGATRLGYTVEDLIGKSVVGLFAASHQQKLSAALMDLVQQSSDVTVVNWEFPLDCHKSNILWVKVVARLEKDANSQPLILMVCEDITAHKQAEDALRESEQRFHSMADTAPVMLWMAGTDGLCNFVNEFWLEFTGRTIEQVIGSGLLWGVHPEDRSYCHKTYQQAFDSRTQFQMEYRFRRADGEYRWVLNTGVPRLTPNGNFAGYIGSGIDITERKLAEVALKESQVAAKAQVEEMENLNRLKDEFLSTVSHELRTPLANMKMAIQMLEIAVNQQPEFVAKMPQPPEQHSKIGRYFQILNNECEREINLINNFLDLQKLDSGKKPVVRETVQLQQFLERVVSLFQARTRSCQQQLQLVVPPNLPTVVCDPFSLERILVELLGNACKYSPAGEQITVTAELKSSQIQLDVSNSGVEIPQAELPKIFDKFYRIPSNDPWKQGGTGLGLALVLKITKYLGGNIEVTSGENQTCFRVTLPLSNLACNF